MTTEDEDGGTDLGRRILDRRRGLGLSREDAASRAGIAPSYLKYLETSTAPSVSASAVDRLADVLGVSPGTLAGAGLESPPGGQPPKQRPAPQPLTAAQCRGYLSAGGVGRIVFAGPSGLEAIPVNYVMLGADIVVRTGERTSLADYAARSRVSFEVDRLDEALAEGWSVLVKGTAHVVSLPAELETVRSLAIAPWAGGERDVYIRIVVSELSGRRIRSST